MSHAVVECDVCFVERSREGAAMRVRIIKKPKNTKDKIAIVGTN